MNDRGKQEQLSRLVQPNMSGELHFVFVTPFLYLLDCFIRIVDFYILHNGSRNDGCWYG